MENSIGTIYPRAVENSGIHSFPKGISSKVNVIARLEFELTNNDVAVQHLSHYIMGTSPSNNRYINIYILNYSIVTYIFLIYSLIIYVLETCDPVRWTMSWKH